MKCLAQKNATNSITDIEALRNKISFQLIFKRYSGRLYKTVAAYMNKADAEDIVQELMIETWNKRDSLKGNADGCLQNYLFIRLKYKILDYYSKKPEHVLWYEALPELIHLSGNNSHDKTILDELHQVINATVREMRPSEREVFELRFGNEYSVQETAKCLGISPKSVVNRFAVAIKTVRENVLKYYDGNHFVKYELTFLVLTILGITL